KHLGRRVLAHDHPVQLGDARVTSDELAARGLVVRGTWRFPPSPAATAGCCDKSEFAAIAASSGPASMRPAESASRTTELARCAEPRRARTAAACDESTSAATNPSI